MVATFFRFSGLFACSIVLACGEAFVATGDSSGRTGAGGGSSSTGTTATGGGSAGSGSGVTGGMATSTAGVGGGGPCASPEDCNDNDACTRDSCDSVEGCKHYPSAVPSDSNVCTADICDPATGEPYYKVLDDCCPHSMCTSGVALNDNCNYSNQAINCISEVCGSEPSCCRSGWDETCIEAATVYCAWEDGPPTCTCAHSYCVEGGPLAVNCDPCVSFVCSAHPSCCTASWDATCVAKALDLCNIPAPPDCQ